MRASHLCTVLLNLTRWRSTASSSFSELLESKPRERLFVLILVFVLVLVLVMVFVLVLVLVMVHVFVLNILEIVLERYLAFETLRERRTRE